MLRKDWNGLIVKERRNKYVADILKGRAVDVAHTVVFGVRLGNNY
jgi:hypothetical protein